MVNQILLQRIFRTVSLWGTVLLAISLTSCASLTVSDAIDETGNLSDERKIEEEYQKDVEIFCLLFGPLHWSRMDSNETIRQIKAHNKTIVNFCNGY